jgi:hypothetical protein
MSPNWFVRKVVNEPDRLQTVYVVILWLRRLVSGCPPRRPGFALQSVNVGFVADTVSLGQVSLLVLRFPAIATPYPEIICGIKQQQFRDMVSARRHEQQQQRACVEYKVKLSVETFWLRSEEEEVSFYSFLTSVLHVGVWSASRFGRFTHREQTLHSPLYRRLGGPQGRFGRRGWKKNSSSVPGTECGSSSPLSHIVHTGPHRLHRWSRRNFLAPAQMIVNRKYWISHAKPWRMSNGIWCMCRSHANTGGKHSLYWASFHFGICVTFAPFCTVQSLSLHFCNRNFSSLILLLFAEFQRSVMCRLVKYIFIVIVISFMLLYPDMV